MKWVCCLVFTLSYWASLGAVDAAPSKTNAPAWQQMQTQLDAQQKAADALQADNKALLERLKTQEQALLETQRKSVDWWLSAIGVGLACFGLVAAIGGVWIPFYFQRSERSRLKEAQAEFERMKQEAKAASSSLQRYEDEAQAELRRIKREAEGALSSLQSHEQAGKKHVESLEAAQEIAKAFQSGQERGGIGDAANTEMKQAVQVLAESSPVDQLRAQAIQASQVEQPTEEQALHAYELWKALTMLDITDQNAQFNAGYWAQKLFEKSNNEKREHWLGILSHHYGLLPTSPGAAYNLGNALSAEAKKIAKSDLVGARSLWSQANEKYAQALANKPDHHKSINNWGCSLRDEAKAIAQDNLSEARKLWAQAGDKYAQALAIKGNESIIANNWGNMLNEEASQIANIDLIEARSFWAKAYEKYAKALVIKADDHEVIINWSGSYLHEVHALRDAGQLEPAAELLQKALALLEGHITRYPQVTAEVAYNHACVYGLLEHAKDAVAQLELSRQAGKLPQHWPEDKDLNPIRQSPEYIAWVQAHFPDQLRKEDK
ncbi:MAG: hypothetical protein LBE51_05835 [Acidovorax sp.]|jgi:hypothetical protein|nr:hypothetical protein [Acidovorax sp.]